MRLGGYVERAQIAGSGSPVSATSYGLTAGFASNGMDFSGYVGKTDTNVLPASLQMTTVGVGATYQVSPALRLGGNIARTSIAESSGSIAMTSVGIAGTYQINDEFAAFGGIVNNSFSFGGMSVTTLGVGASYDMTKVANFPVVVSLEVARTQLGITGGSGRYLDSIRLGLTIPFGNKGNNTPLNSVADSVFTPTHGMVSSLINTSF
jgi:hypothetical protein